MVDRRSWVTLGIVMVAMGGGSVRAESACRSCRVPFKGIPDRVPAWEAKVGLAGLRSGPLVAVTLPLNVRAARLVTDLAHYAGQPVTLDAQHRDLHLRLPVVVVKALLARGFDLGVEVDPLVGLKAQANDTCATALPVEVNVPASGTTVGAMEGDVWYRFSPPETGDYVLSLAESRFDTLLEVYDGCGGESIAYDDDGGPGATSRLTLFLEAERTYWIRIAGFGDSRGDYVLRVSHMVQRPGATCALAVPLDPNVPAAGTTDEDRPEVWYRFTATADGFVLIHTAGSVFDTLLEVYDHCAGTVLKSDDDSGPGLSSQLGLAVHAGQSYTLRVSGVWGQTGAYRLSVTPYAARPGEFPEVAIDLPAGVADTGDTTPMLEEAVWYAYTPAVSGPVVVSLLGSDFDTFLAVIGPEDDSLLAFNDDAGPWRQSRLSVDLDAGVTYWLLVTGYTRRRTGAYRIELTPVSRPPHDAVAWSQPLVVGPVHEGSTDGASSTLAASLCGVYDSRDVWYRLVAPFSGFLSVTVDANVFDPTLTLFDEQGGVELTCSDDAEIDCTLNARATQRVEAGRAYLVRVAGTMMTTGPFRLQARALVDQPPLTPAEPQPGSGDLLGGADPVLTWDQGPALSPLPPRRVGLIGPIYQAVFGHDDRRDAYEIEDPRLQALGDATVVLVDREDLVQDAAAGTYTLTGPSLRQWANDSLCEDEPYLEQPSIGFCSGFLVAPDLIVTAGHCTGCAGDIGQTLAVFGFVMRDANTPVLTVPASDVYPCREVVATQNGDPDWGLVRLDRPVQTHRPLRLRRTGRVAERQPLTVIGHPLGLPRKTDQGGTVRDNWERNHFGATLDTFGGNSGSAVLDRDSGRVEGILVWGQEDFLYDAEADCLRSSTCPEAGCPGWERATRITLLSELVPAYDLWLGDSPQTLAPLATGLPLPEYRPVGLLPGRTYYWQVHARNGGGVTVGPIWSFTVSP